MSPAWTSVRSPAATAALTAALALSTLNVTAPATWRRIDSPNFVVIGDGSAGQLRDIAIRFEGFRETLARVLGIRLVDSAVPTLVAAFPSDYAMEPFRPVYNGKPVEVAGLCMPGPDINYIVIVDDDNKERQRVVFHEYMHLATTIAGQQLPAWLDEGLAEYYSTAEIFRGGREAIVGGLIDWHLARLNDTILMPVAELLQIDHSSPLYNEGSRRSVFYAESWALVHMLLLGQPSRTAELSAYLDLLARGAEPLPAWQKAFAGIDVDQELARYIQKRDFRGVKYEFSDAVAKFDGQAAVIPPADVEAYLAGLHTRLRDPASAEKRLAEANALDAGNARALVGAVRLQDAQGQPGDGIARLRSLPTPDDWLLSYLAGVTLAGLLEQQGAPSEEDVAAVRRFLGPAALGAEEFPNAVAHTARLELVGRAAPTEETVAALERARQQAPGRYDYTLLHAQLLARRAEFAGARAVLGPLMASAPARIRTLARDLMGKIAELELARASGAVPVPPFPPRPASPVAPPPATTTTSTPEPKVRPLFRALKPGEQRLEGVLERIECAAGRGITFHLKVGDTPATATAALFDQVDFITYRDDLTGSVRCGPLKTPLPVYLTWRPGAGPDERVTVAIEFLPKGAGAPGA